MSDTDPERELPVDSPIANGDSIDPWNPVPADTGADRPAGESLDEGSGLSAEPFEPEAEPDAAQAPWWETSSEQPSSRANALWEKASKHPHLPSAIKRIAARRLDADFAEQHVRYRAQEDPEANAATRLVSGEQVLAPVIWLAEVFTPTTIDNLVKGMRGLTAEADEIAEWLLSSRRRPQERFGYFPVHIVPRGRPILAPRSVDQLPAGIDLVHPMIQTLTSTVTVLIVTFALTNDRARGLADILNQDFVTQAKMDPYGSFEILDVARQKVDAVNEWRSALHREAAHWIADRFPGFFCKIAPERMPSINLLLTESYIPWEFRAGDDIPEWAKIIDLTTGSGYWQAKENDVLRLSQGTGANQPNSFTLAAVKSKLPSLGGISARSSNLGEAIARLDLSIPFLHSRWSLSALLTELEEQTPSIQDAADRVGRDSSPRALAQAQQQLLRSGLDNRIVANDIVRFTADPKWKWNVPDFSEVLPPSSSPAREPIDSLADSLRKGQEAGGQRVAQLGADLREVLSTNANLAAAGANLRLGRRVFWLTIVSVIVAIVAAIAAVVPVLRPSTPSTTTPTVHQSSPPAHQSSPQPIPQPQRAASRLSSKDTADRPASRARSVSDASHSSSSPARNSSRIDPVMWL